MVTDSETDKEEKKRADYEEKSLTEILNADTNKKKRLIKVRDTSGMEKYALTGSSIKQKSLTEILGGPL